MPSKKRSAARPPDGTVFFVDRSLGIEPIRSELVKAHLAVEIHDEHFARDEEDRVWLRAVSERDWVVLTKDQRLRYRPREVGALRDSIEIATAFMTALPRISRILHSHAGPFVARVSQSGQVTIIAMNGPGKAKR